MPPGLAEPDPRALARSAHSELVVTEIRTIEIVDPVADEQFEQVVSELFSLNAPVVARLRELLR